MPKNSAIATVNEVLPVSELVDISIDTLETMPMPIETVDTTTNNSLPVNDDASKDDTTNTNDTTANQPETTIVVKDSYTIGISKFDIQPLQSELEDGQLVDDTESYAVMITSGKDELYIQHNEDVVLFDSKLDALKGIAKFVSENLAYPLPIVPVISQEDTAKKAQEAYDTAMLAYNTALEAYNVAESAFSVKAIDLVKRLPNGKLLVAGKQFDLLKGDTKIGSFKSEAEASQAKSKLLPPMPVMPQKAESSSQPQTIENSFTSCFFNINLAEKDGLWDATVNNLTATNFTSRDSAITQFINPTHSFIKNMLLSEANRVLGVEYKPSVASKPRAKKSTEKAEPSHADKKTSDEIYNSIRENHPDGYALAKLHQSSQNWSDVLLEAESMGGRALAYRDMLREHTRKTGIVLLDTDDTTPTELLTLATQSGKQVKLISRKSPISEQK